jgi:hypothetical protein
MKSVILSIIVLLIVFSCQNDTKSLQVNGHIKGFHKGTVYLEKMKDTLRAKVDSIFLDDKTEFHLSDDIESPEIYFLTLSGSSKTLKFFAEKGTISIKTDIDKFEYKYEVSGSKNQELLEQYNENISKFNNQRLELIKANFEAAKAKNQDKRIEIEKKLVNWVKRKNRYALNFAFNNADYEVSPYVVLTDLYNLKLNYLDTIVNAFPDKVKTSKYGVKLIEFVNEIKEKDTITKK